MERWELHTTVKLNPTLLGPEELSFILHDQLGFDDVTVPDEAFAHDPTFAEMVHIIEELEGTAERNGLAFAVKVCNTLEVINHRDVFNLDQTRMYLSGRPLHAVAVRLARRLSDAFDGRLRISFAGGSDAFNTPNLLAAGLCPVTTCSDLLRPGGYLRLRQYLENIRSAMEMVGATDLDELIMRTAGQQESGDRFNLPILEAARQNLSCTPTVCSSTPPCPGVDSSAATPRPRARSDPSTASRHRAPTRARWSNGFPTTCGSSGSATSTPRRR